MNIWMERCGMYGQVNEWMGGGRDGCREGQRKGGTDGLIGGWMNRQMN